MYLELNPRFAGDPKAQRAAELTEACVHCGFCLSTCPTYRDARDERDSPRGRIYLIKHMLESGEASQSTRQHLDRCLTCRNCETACPSGMRYGELVDIGREFIEREAPRSAVAKVQRRLLREVFVRPGLMSVFLAIGQLVRPLLPGMLRSKVPPRQSAGQRPATNLHQRRVLILEGCVQQAATPATNAAAARILDRLGISLVSAPGADCCGALDFHLSAQEAALQRMRRNIDAWWPAVEQGAEAIVITASGCGATVKEYGHLLRDDPLYAEKADRVSSIARDLSEILNEEALERLSPVAGSEKIALHVPCSLQHGQALPDNVEIIFRKAGFALSRTKEKHLCCGSAGTYSLLQPEMSQNLRARKLKALCGDDPTVIATANVGCQLHLEGGTDLPVRHWIELLDRACA